MGHTWSHSLVQLLAVSFPAFSCRSWADGPIFNRYINRYLWDRYLSCGTQTAHCDGLQQQTMGIILACPRFLELGFSSQGLVPVPVSHKAKICQYKGKRSLYETRYVYLALINLLCICVQPCSAHVRMHTAAFPNLTLPDLLLCVCVGASTTAGGSRCCMVSQG